MTAKQIKERQKMLDELADELRDTAKHSFEIYLIDDEHIKLIHKVCNFIRNWKGKRRIK